MTDFQDLFVIKFDEDLYALYILFVVIEYCIAYIGSV